MSSLGDIIRQGNSSSQAAPKSIQINLQKSKPPVKFTDDPLEYFEGKEYLGEKLFPKQREIISTFFSTCPETKARLFNELILIIGMRGGKSFLAGAIGSFCANKLMALGPDYKSYFKISKASTISIPVIANSEDQADKTIYGYIKQFHTTYDFWKRVNQWLIDMEPLGMKNSYFQEDNKSLHYKYYDLNLTCVPSTSDTLAGLTSYCTLFDEISRLRVSQGDLQGKTEKKTAQAIYYTLIRQIKTFKNQGNSVVVSSPMYEDDFGMQLLLKSGKLVTGEVGEMIIPMLSEKIPSNQKKKTRLGYHYASWEYNEELTEKDFEDEKRESITTFKRDFMAIPPASLEPFFEDRIALRQAINPVKKHIAECHTEIIEKHRTDIATGAILDTRRYVTKKLDYCLTDKMTKRVICCDQGVKWDNFCVGIGHGVPVQVERESGIKHFLKTVIDAIIIWESMGEDAQVEFDNVEEIILELTKHLLIEVVTYDQWQSTKPVQTLFDKNVNSQVLKATSTMYQSFKKRLYQGLVESVDTSFEFKKKDNVLMDELIKLQLIKGGKIDHPPSGSKDVSDIICRIDALVQNQENELYGGDQKNLKGGLVYLNPQEASFTPQYAYEVLKTTYGGSTLWGESNVPKQNRVAGIWQPARKIGGEHPAQHFFRKLQR